MMFLFDKKDQDDTEQKNKEFYQQIDWDMILCIALIELYTREKWIDLCGKLNFLIRFYIIKPCVT